MVHRRHPKSSLMRWLEKSPQPIYALDERRRILFANDAALDWLGVSQEQLLGRTCDYHSRTDAEWLQGIAATLCPPPEVYAGQTVRAPVGGFERAEHSTQPNAERTAQFWPVACEPDSFLVIAFVDPD